MITCTNALVVSVLAIRQMLLILPHVNSVFFAKIRRYPTTVKMLQQELVSEGAVGMNV